MRAKLLDMNRWQMLDIGHSLVLPGKRRQVTLEVNVETVTRLDVMENGKGTLLRVVEPSECPAQLVFVVSGDCEVVPTTEGEVWWYTDDGATLNHTITTKSFTKLEQRMEMTPEMEVTILKANIRLEQRRREVAELMLVKQQREDAAAAGADPETGVIPDDEVPVADDAGAGGGAPSSGDGVASEPQPAGDGGTPEPAAATSAGPASAAK